jgi:FkbM family methyltransferase
VLKKEKLEDFYARLLNAGNRPRLNQTFEGIINSLYIHFLRPGDTAVDVGSHTGSHTKEMAKRIGPEGKVYSFEPIPDFFKQQKAMLKKDSLSNVFLKKTAVSNFSGRSTFRIIEGLPGISGLKPMPHQRDLKARIIKTEVSTLDELIKDKTGIKFIKVDTEGADFYVLQGAEQILEKCRPAVVFECGAFQKGAAQSYGYTREAFTSFFQKTGYQLFSILGLDYNPDLWHSKGPSYLVGFPIEKKETFREILWLSVLKVLFNIPKHPPLKQ